MFNPPSVDIKTHKIVFSNSIDEKEGMFLTLSQYNQILYAIQKKEAFITIEGRTIKRSSISEILKIKDDERKNYAEERYFTEENLIGSRVLPNGEKHMIYELVKFKYSPTGNHEEIARKRCYYDNGKKIYV